MEREEFLSRRKNYICGSDISAICGINPYKSPLSVYLDKLNLVKDDDSISEPARFGTLLEDVVAQEYARRTGNTVSVDTTLFVHPEYSFAAANIDRWVGDKEFILECKTTGYSGKKLLGAEGTDEVVDYWLTQVAWYAGVCDVPKVDIAVLIAGQEFRTYTYHRNREFEAKLFRIAKNFWENHILKQTPPEEMHPSDIPVLFPQDSGEKVLASDEICEKIQCLKELKAKQKELSTTVEKVQMEVQKYMGENAVLTTNRGEILATWRNTKPRRSFDAKALQSENADLYENYIKEVKTPRMFLVK